MQRGYVFKKKGGKSWYGRWREDAIKNGQLVRRQHCEKLADVSDRYRSKKDVQPLLDEKLKPLNNGRSDARSTMAVADYVRDYYLPEIKDALKPSTYRSYEFNFRHYLAPHLEKVALRDFRCVDATDVLDRIYLETGIRRKMLRHIKAFLSVVFTHAKQRGVLDGGNPIEDAGIPRRALTAKKTIAASPEQVLAMLNVLNGTAKTAVALIYFGGLRPGEARALRWTDLDRDKESNIIQFRVCQSQWGTHLSSPKTEDSVAPVPVCDTLRAILDETLNGSEYILAGPKLGRPINLNNLARRVVRPALKKAGIPWAGWYSLRRGIGTLATQVHSSLAAKGWLRHANVATTEQHYIKDVPAETQRAAEKVDQLFRKVAVEATS